ncbi:MAG: hypothetical protein JJ939_11560 [Alphaproteobacteria bacterium]|nr:hypothetical protein [Alphaproteobacteria bacterium]MBO6629052.1 hypothetical protein [Alphaproteobacteria bacterium]
MTDLSKYEGHTPGPWDAEGPDGFGDYNIVQRGTNPAIAAVVSNLREPEIIAEDARLIADAPAILEYARELEARNAELVQALVEAAKKIDEQYDPDMGWCPMGPSQKEVFAKIKSALSRAKGEEA